MVTCKLEFKIMGVCSLTGMILTWTITCVDRVGVPLSDTLMYTVSSVNCSKSILEATSMVPSLLMVKRSACSPGWIE